LRETGGAIRRFSSADAESWRSDSACRMIELGTAKAGISPNTLSARLKRLEEHGVVERRFYEQHPPRAEYVLTDKGRQLGPVLKALFDWGRKHTAAPAEASSGG